MNTIEDIKRDFYLWLGDENISEGMKHHGAKCSTPIPREPQYWPDMLLDFSDAYAWAQSLIADAADYETRAMALLTVDKTIKQAEGDCSEIIRWHRALRRLAESADRRTSVLQSAMRGRP